LENFTLSKNDEDYDFNVDFKETWWCIVLCRYCTWMYAYGLLNEHVFVSHITDWLQHTLWSCKSFPLHSVCYTQPVRYNDVCVTPCRNVISTSQTSVLICFLLQYFGNHLPDFITQQRKQNTFRT
jgi:hypothetical protein